MTTAISFTLPDHVHARDLPRALSPLTEPGPGGSTVLHSASPLVHLQMLGDWALAAALTFPTSTSTAQPWKRSTSPLPGPRARRISDDQDGPALSGYDLRAFARNRQSQFFTLAMPVLFLVIFASVFGGSGHTTQIVGIGRAAYGAHVPGRTALALRSPW